MFSKACEYGIRSLIIIAESGEIGKRIGIKELCKKAKTPEPFTAKILQNLVKKRIIQSQKGPSGGFFMTRDPKDISLYQIVEAIDGDEVFIKCGLGLDQCNAKKPCPLHNQFEVVRTDLMTMCKNNSLADLRLEYRAEVFNR